MSTFVLGNFDLTDWAGLAYNTSVIAEGTSRGGPVSIDVAVQSWLQDGSIVVTQGYDNREVTLRVRLRGPDLLDLARAEKALFAELGKPNTLTWTPPDGFGPPSVFEVVTSSMVEAPGAEGDLAEASAFPWRTYNLRLVCKAFVRSATEVVTTAEKSGDTTTLPTVTQVTVDDGSSATGWQGDYFRFTRGNTQIDAGATTVSASGGEVYSLTPLGQGDRTIVRLVKTMTIDVSMTKQLAVDWRWDQSPDCSWQAVSFKCLVNESIELPLIDGMPTPVRNVTTRANFKVPDSLSTISSLRLIFEVRLPPSSILPTLGNHAEAFYVDKIERNNANLASGTPRQLQRTIEVPGSARSQSSVMISHNVSALGDVLAYFRPEDGSLFSPPLRRWRVSGPGATTDTTLVSGLYDNIASGLVSFRVPAQRVPAGRYLLMARLGGADTACNILWNAGTMFGSTDVGPTYTGTTAIALTTAYRIFPIARLLLPTRDLDEATSANVRVELLGQPALGTVCRLDEAWLFDLSTGRLVQVPCGTGTPAVGGAANRVWIEPASVERPRPTVRIGSLADGSDARHGLDSSFAAWQFPELTPPSVQVFTVTTNALDAQVSLRGYPRYHTHAAS